ncbi:MAG: hypothetical protein ACRDYB_14050 [Acidimicrobiales bacterium]
MASVGRRRWTGADGQHVGAVAGVADWLHVDILDAHFAAQPHHRAALEGSLRRHSGLTAHLMMTDPGDYLQAFRDSGADGCTVHVEAGPGS